MTFDELRRDHPHLCVAAYAYELGGPVTLELIDVDGVSRMFVAPTLRDAIDATGECIAIIESTDDIFA